MVWQVGMILQSMPSAALHSRWDITVKNTANLSGLKPENDKYNMNFIVIGMKREYNIPDAILIAVQSPSIIV